AVSLTLAAWIRTSAARLPHSERGRQLRRPTGYATTKRQSRLGRWRASIASSSEPGCRTPQYALQASRPSKPPLMFNGALFLLLGRDQCPARDAPDRRLCAE